MTLLLMTKPGFDYPQTLVLTFLCIAFLAGSIPFGLLVARLYGVDIRKVGSGNIGMTNVWRQLGWKAGVLVLVLDIAKGYFPVIASMRSLQAAWANWWSGHGNILELWPYSKFPLEVGIAAVLGHTFSPWLKFKGGKGVATGLGVAIALFGAWILVPLVIFLVVLALWRMVSLASILAAFVLALLGYIMDHRVGSTYYSASYPEGGTYVPHFAFGLLALLLILYTHRSNIRRILNGTENKVSLGRRRGAAPDSGS